MSSVLLIAKLWRFWCILLHWIRLDWIHSLGSLCNSNSIIWISFSIPGWLIMYQSFLTLSVYQNYMGHFLNILVPEVKILPQANWVRISRTAVLILVVHQNHFWCLFQIPLCCLTLETEEEKDQEKDSELQNWTDLVFANVCLGILWAWQKRVRLNFV